MQFTITIMVLLALFTQLIDVFEQVLPCNEFCKRFSPSSADTARHEHALSGTRFTAIYFHLDAFFFIM